MPSRMAFGSNGLALMTGMETSPVETFLRETLLGRGRDAVDRDGDITDCTWKRLVCVFARLELACTARPYQLPGLARSGNCSSRHDTHVDQASSSRTTIM